MTASEIVAWIVAAAYGALWIFYTRSWVTSARNWAEKAMDYKEKAEEYMAAGKRHWDLSETALADARSVLNLAVEYGELFQRAIIEGSSEKKLLDRFHDLGKEIERRAEIAKAKSTVERGN